MKKRVSLILAALLLAASLTGCGQTGTESIFTAANEIFTYERIDPEKTQLVVSTLGVNSNASALSAAFEMQNPDVQVICIDITGGNAAHRPVIDWITNGIAPDAMFVNLDTFVSDDFIIEHFENLSAHPVIQQYEMEALSNLAVDANVYFLPDPSEINCMVYNKTLFDRYGWKVPNTFDEFVSLCLKIREDTDGTVQPWNPGGKYESVFSVVTEAFVYAELFSGAENRDWYNNFLNDEATFAGHMEPYFDMLQTLIDNDLLLEEHFSYSATTRGKEFSDGQIAMVNNPASWYDSDVYEFAYMPFPTTQGELGYVNEYYRSLFCVPKKKRGDA